MPGDSLPPDKKVIALFVRHGKTSLNTAKRPRLRAWEDPPLTDEGRADIQMTANKLKIYRPKMVYSSDFHRDYESAVLVAEILGNIPYETDFSLRTANVGTLSGMLEEDVVARELRWYQNPSEPAPSGESFNQFGRRLWGFLEPKIELAREVAAFRPTVFLTHGRAIAYLDSYYRGIPPEDAIMPKPAGVAVLRSNVNGMDSLEFLGETEAVQKDV
jgi:glucosyl-3-phosphoglycerate phosphatase